MCFNVFQERAIRNIGKEIGTEHKHRRLLPNAPKCARRDAGKGQIVWDNLYKEREKLLRSRPEKRIPEKRELDLAVRPIRVIKCAG